MQPPDVNLVDLALEYWPKQVRSCMRGSVLYWQGDPVETLYVIQKGVVRISSVSSAGRMSSHGFLGRGHLLGATEYFFGGIHVSTAQVIDDTSLVVVPLSEFEGAIARNRGFSAIVMRELAKSAKGLFLKAQDLSLLDVKQRLKHSLIELANELGLETQEGVEINTNISHEDLAQLINANRTTVTLCLRELRELGYLRTEGRRFILVPVGHRNTLDQLGEAVLSGVVGEAADLATTAIELGIHPVNVLNVLMNGMKEVDRRYARGQMDLSDLMWSSTHVKEALPIIETAIQHEGIRPRYLGRVVFGTVRGDIHDIGKTMVSMLLRARGFEVIDLGVDVAAERFVEAVTHHMPDVLAMSALLTTTQSEMKNVIEALKDAGLRDRVRIMIGGASTSPRFAREVGADAWGADARAGVELAWGWCSNPRDRFPLHEA
jgi:methanogenic corrinoid protein MtbC1